MFRCNESEAFMWWAAKILSINEYAFWVLKAAQRNNGGCPMIFTMYLNKIEMLKKFNGTLISMNANTIFKKYV